MATEAAIQGYANLPWSLSVLLLSYTKHMTRWAWMLFWATHPWNSWAFGSWQKCYFIVTKAFSKCHTDDWFKCHFSELYGTDRKADKKKNISNSRRTAVQSLHRIFYCTGCRPGKVPWQVRPLILQKPHIHRKRKNGTAKFKPPMILYYQHPEIYNTAAWSSCLLLSSKTTHCLLYYKEELPSTGSSWGDGWQIQEEGITNRAASLHLGSFGGCSSSFFLRNLLLVSFLIVQRAAEEGGEKVDREQYYGIPVSA